MSTVCVKVKSAVSLGDKSAVRVSVSIIEGLFSKSRPTGILDPVFRVSIP